MRPTAPDRIKLMPRFFKKKQSQIHSKKELAELITMQKIYPKKTKKKGHASSVLK